MSGFAPLGRLISLAMICAGLGTSAVLATADTAQAAGPNGPTAIGVSSGGTSYVGFASGGELQRLSAQGRHQKAITLDQDEAVDGLFVTPDDDVWVDYETGVSQLTPDGRLVRHFDHDPVVNCDNTAPASRYGGITVRGDRVYVANRCSATVSVYSRGGVLVATLDLPGNSYPRGITYGRSQAGRPATLYVALPDRGQILAYNAENLRNGSQPTNTFNLARPYGGSRPEPAGLVVDKYGQVAASDIANNALYFLDSNNNYSIYRTLGHPPGASREVGRLNAPGAIAQHGQDGGGLAGNLFVADTNNSRVQRWSTGGYTYWAKGVHAGAGGGGSGGGGGGGSDSAPVNSLPPEVTGDLEVGSTLSCYVGKWTGLPDSFQRAWLRDGEIISGATGTYTLDAFDVGKLISCRVRATNDNGTSDWADSAAVSIGGGGGGGSGPVNGTPPAISGTAAVGEALTCNPGTWTSSGGPASGSIALTYQWNRAGVAISGATGVVYTVVAADDGKTVTCTVKATDLKGSTSVTSDPVTVGGSGGSDPVNTVLPAITGTPAVGQVLTCSRGTWVGLPTISYLYGWLRDGAPIGGATSATYTPVAADLGTSVACLVVAVNGYGAGAETTAPVVIAAPICPGAAVGVSINAGADQVVGSAVTLSIRPPAGATTMTISNDGGFAGVSTVTVPAGCSTSWTLAPGFGTRFVYVRFDDSTAAPYFDNIDVVSARPLSDARRFW